MGINDTYQRELARSLVVSLGIADALDFCRQNQWEGVLRIIDKTYGDGKQAEVNGAATIRH